jgi:UPF0755 protein
LTEEEFLTGRSGDDQLRPDTSGSNSPPDRSKSGGEPITPPSNDNTPSGKSHTTEAIPLTTVEGVPPGAIGHPDPAPSGRSAMGRHPWRTLVISVAVILVAAGGAGVLWIDHQGTVGRTDGQEVVIHVTKRVGAATVASMLERKKVVGSSLALEAWLLLHGTPTIGIGTYVFHQHESFASVKSDLEVGPNVFSLEVAPGSSVGQVSRQVDQVPGHDGSAFLALATGGTLHSPWSPAGSSRLDGLLGAGTYQVMPGETDAQLLIQMIDRFNQMANAVGLALGAQRMGRTPYEVITVASIVQKEAVLGKNMAPLARVIYNRMAAGMPLPSSATVRIAQHRDGAPVNERELQGQASHKTFDKDGLAPIPICLPSAAALRAALNPPRGSWRYYAVTQRDGTESFATTAAQERANEALARRRGLQ